jgi:hypothetical protein
MMHIDDTQLRRFRRGELTLDELSAAGRHAAECEACRERMDASVSVHGLRAWIDGASDGDPDIDAELHAYLDDVDDFRSVAKPRRGIRPLFWILPTAAALILISGLVVMKQEKTAPSVAPRVAHVPAAPKADRYPRADWNALVRESLASGTLARPAVLADMAMIAGRLRGEPVAEATALAPAGIVVEAARPRFTWPAVDGAEYVVAVYDGRREVARSRSIHATSWTPARALIRGRTYGWQVEVHTDADDRIIPEPPAPPAVVHVLGERELADIEAARALAPDDHLLLGLLYARAGLVREAESELRRVPEAAGIARSLESW